MDKQLEIKIEELKRQELKQLDEAFTLKQKTETLELDKKNHDHSVKLLKIEKNALKEAEEKRTKEDTVNKKQQYDKEFQLNALQRQLDVRAQEIENGLPKLAKLHIAEQVQLLEKQKEALQSDKAQLHEQQKAFIEKQNELEKRNDQLIQLQQEADSDFSAQRSDVHQELAKIRTEKLTQLNLKMAEEEQQAREQIDQSLLQQSLDLKNDQEILKQAQGRLAANELNLQKIDANLKQQQSDLTKNIDQRMEEERNRLEDKIDNLKRENEFLLTQVKQSDFAIKLYASLERELDGQSPEKVLQLLRVRNEEINRLQEDLSTRPSEEIKRYYDDAKKQVDTLKCDNEHLNNKNIILQDEMDKTDQIEYELNREKQSHGSLKSRYDALNADNNKLREEIARINPAYEDKQTRVQRISGVKREVIPFVNHHPLPRNQSNEINELSWLKKIKSDMADYGLLFNERILFAFHTALKTAEWSPLTVLAGVSGTGKSELPKLYSHFGGINFLNVPVQPNWDSQESMLGYFNSIDNCFEAQPMLNFLAQSREPLVLEGDERYHGLDDTVSLVLLDEMNLAHVELYFADFLSKLEQRRGCGKNKLPSISIKLGANIAPYEISLGRNILFTGTMNQDETTKSLSDKVIDRGTSIFFPRPKTLHPRQKLKVLSQPAALLKMKSWSKWILLESGHINTSSYKTTIEQINEHLGCVGKALGHRVWQSIEYYMVNHPLVRALDSARYPDQHKEVLNLAFDDQIVQKVMPKLRGIETRGFAKTDCLDKIRTLFDEKEINLLVDFDHACRVGHGQFMWASAEYLNDENTNKRYSELLNLAMDQASEESRKCNTDQNKETADNHNSIQTTNDISGTDNTKHPDKTAV